MRASGLPRGGLASSSPGAIRSTDRLNDRTGQIRVATLTLARQLVEGLTESAKRVDLLVDIRDLPDRKPVSRVTVSAPIQAKQYSNLCQSEPGLLRALDSMQAGERLWSVTPKTSPSALWDRQQTPPLVVTYGFDTDTTRLGEPSDRHVLGWAVGHEYPLTPYYGTESILVPTPPERKAAEEQRWPARSLFRTMKTPRAWHHLRRRAHVVQLIQPPTQAPKWRSIPCVE